MNEHRWVSDELTPSLRQRVGLSSTFNTVRLASKGQLTVLEPQFEQLQGMTAVIASQQMRKLMALAAKVGKTNSPVLITGESGTGKEIFARTIHQHSARAFKPLVDVNCAALPEHLVESELFGYEKGAFSGAENMKQGLFEAAHGGTLFLDEIAELETHIQAKLLRVLDGQPHYRLGGTRKVIVDVRIIAATNLDLHSAIKEGRFRSDLFHRLDAFHIRIPPLRERIDDIGPIAEFFLRGTGVRLSPEALAILEEYHWPGNVRELKNTLNKASVFSTGTEILPHDLPLEVLSARAEATEDTCSLDGLEQKTIIKVLAQTNGHQQKAADLLGISRRTLIRKLNLYRGPGNRPGRLGPVL